MCIGDSPDYSQAAAIEAQAAERAAKLQMEMYQQARSDVAPWRTGGTAAEQQLGGLYGLPGYKAVDPAKTLQATPGYQWGLSQGIGAMDASAAAKGLALSGPQRQAVTQFGTDYATKAAWQPYVGQLNTMSGQGLQAGGLSGNWALQTGQNVGQDYMAAAQAQAQALIQQQNAQNQGLGGWMQGLGMLGGLALAPFTGGTSLIGAGISGLGSMFGGGGGGGGGFSGGGSMFDIGNTSLGQIGLSM